MYFFCFSFSRYIIKLKKTTTLHGPFKRSVMTRVGCFSLTSEDAEEGAVTTITHNYSYKSTYSCFAGSYDLQNMNTLMSLNSSNGSKCFFFICQRFKCLFHFLLCRTDLRGNQSGWPPTRSSTGFPSVSPAKRSGVLKKRLQVTGSKGTVGGVLSA